MFTVSWAYFDGCFYDLRNSTEERYDTKEEAFARRDELKKMHGGYVLVNIYKNSIKIA